MLAFWGIALWGWLASGYIQPLLLFGYIGTSIGVGLGLYATLPKKRKPLGRRLTLFLVGGFLFGFAVLVGKENSQIEGAIFGLLTGVVQMGVIHYMIAKIFGPVLFGRLWCGWACWTVMVLDLLPFTRPSGRLPGRWGWLRYLHFGLSLSLVLLLVFVFGFRDGATGGVCPVAVPLKLTTRFSLLKIGGVVEKCNDCGACVKTCPMDVCIPEYILDGRRVLTTECSLCQTCIIVCAREALKLSFGFDLGGKDLLRERIPSQKPTITSADWNEKNHRYFVLEDCSNRSSWLRR